MDQYQSLSSIVAQRSSWPHATALVVAFAAFSCGADDSLNQSPDVDGGPAQNPDIPDGGSDSATSDAALVALSLGDSPVEPVFAPETLAYSATVPLSLVATSTPALLTARARDPKASISINGQNSPSGTLSVTISTVPTSIEVAVTAQDGRTVRRYTVNARSSTRPVPDYAKASNTRTRARFGESLAFDAHTLVVGSPYESSNARGIGGNEADTSATGAGAVYVFEKGATGPLLRSAYIKASNTPKFPSSLAFGISVAIHGDTVVVGAPGEDGGSAGVNGDQTDTTKASSGAVYIFVRSGSTWTQQAYVKASNPRPGAGFGRYVAISGDTVVVGSIGETSGMVDNPNDTSATSAGAAYVFTRTGTTWAQTAYLKASSPRANAAFGSVAIDGDTLVVGAQGESSCAAGVDGDQANTSCPFAGAAYVFGRSNGLWSQQAYLKASNPRPAANFGRFLSISGNTIALGSGGESSNAKGINGNDADASLSQAGAAYVFVRNGATWSQQAYVKASNTQAGALFSTVALRGDVLAVGAIGESSAAKGLNGDQTDTSAPRAGAAYLFRRTAGAWSQSAYVKASNPRAQSLFGSSVALSADGLAVGAYGESSAAVGVNGDQTSTSAPEAGAVYVY